MRHSSRQLAYWGGSLLLVVFCILAGYSPLAAEKTKLSDVTEVVVIEVPVQVTHNGKPVRGLTPEQFEVFDGRKQRELTGFDAYDLTGSEGEASPMGLRIPAAAQRRFLFFFDLAFSEPNSIMRAQQSAQQVVSESLAPTDLVAVATYTTSGGADLIVGFTSDRRQVGVAIETLGLPQLVAPQRDPLSMQFVFSPGAGLPLQERIPGTQGGIEGVNETSGDLAFALTRVSNERTNVKNAILEWVGSMSEVAELLRSVEGRKHLVYLSEGFESSVLFGQAGGLTYEEQESLRIQTEAAQSGQTHLVDSNLRFGDTSTQNQLGSMLREFVRADCAIHAVDIGSLAAGGSEQSNRKNTEALFMLAEGTGGELFENFNNPTEAMSRLMERTSVTYVLAFQADDLKLDGEFHKLKVKLDGGLKGAQLVYRPGYFAPRPYSELSARERSLTAASQLYGEPGGEVGVATLAAPFEIGSQPAYVPSLIEVNGGDLLRGVDGDQVTAEIFAYAIAANGEVRDYYNQILGIDLEKAGAALEQKGLKFWSQFEVPPGEYLARVLVRNAGTGASGVSVFPFHVPDPSQGESALLPPLFPEPAGQWLNVQGQRAEESQHDYPFTVQGQTFVPAAKPILTTGQSTAVLLAGYGLGDAVRVRAELLTSKGAPAGRVFLNVGEGRLADIPGLTHWAATIQLGAVEAGDYLLRITATDPDSGESHSSSLTIEVSG